MIDPNIDRSLVRPAEAPQITLPKRELDRLAQQIDEDYTFALSDHQERMRRFQAMYLRWRQRREDLDPNEYIVPLTQWHVFTKWAKEHGALFGEDSEVVSKAVGPSDQEKELKSGRFMTWLLFQHMKIQNKAAVFNFRKTLFGRSFAYTPWVRETFMVPTVDGDEIESVSFEGPGFDPLLPDDFIVPAEEGIQSLHDFSYVCRKYRATPDDLLRGEGTQYQAIEKNFENIVAAAAKNHRDGQADPMKDATDIAEGVIRQEAQSAANTLQVIEWYGKWRMLAGRGDAKKENIRRRERYERELVVRYLPALNLIIGIQDLAQMYPLKRKRRPFVEASLVKDGSYWCAGFGELLDMAERELTVNHAIASKAGKFSVGPVIFYTLDSGFDPDSFEYEPNTAIPVQNPAGINVVQLKADLTYPTVKEQTVNGYAERVTGQSDMNMGRSIDRPNAPRTARQTIALLEEGDVRAELDTAALREDWGLILEHFWDLVAMYAPRNMFFRVTEEDARGLFQVSQGGAFLSEGERFGRYDFEMKFATSAVSRERKKEETLALYQVAVQNPLVMSNPRALWMLLNMIFKTFGNDRFADIIPEPPDLGLPMKPSEEWTRMLQGEEVTINPMDNDDLHLLDHQFRLREELALEEGQQNPMALAQLKEHMVAHIQQRQEKKYMQAIAGELAKTINPAAMLQGDPSAEGGGAPQMPGMIPGMNPGQAA